MDRRHFLKLLGSSVAATGLSSALPFFAKAALPEDQYLLVYEMSFGWDISLGLDPWTQDARPDASDYFLEYSPNDLFQVGNAVYGPAMSQIKNVLNDFSVIRGVFIAPSDSGHTAAMTMMRSGSGGKTPDLPMEFASTFHEENLGVLTRNALNGADRKVNAYSIDDLNNPQQSSLSSSMASSGGALMKARQSGLLLAPKFQDFADNRKLLAPDVSALSQDPELNRIVNIASAFKAGLSRSALIESALNLDTHSNHEHNHLAEQTKGWQTLAKIVDVLKCTPMNDGQSLFDKTTIVVYSEFARTPSLNAAKGKDHNPLVNSVLVSGPGFKKGAATGGSRIVPKAASKTGLSYHVALPYNFETSTTITEKNQFNQGGMITPEHVMATIADNMGLDRGTFACAKSTTPSIKAILKG